MIGVREPIVYKYNSDWCEMDVHSLQGNFSSCSRNSMSIQHTGVWVVFLLFVLLVLYIHQSLPVALPISTVLCNVHFSMSLDTVTAMLPTEYPSVCDLCCLINIHVGTSKCEEFLKHRVSVLHPILLHVPLRSQYPQDTPQ